MMIDNVAVEHVEGFYHLTITGSGFGGQDGAISVWNADGSQVQHVNPLSWNDSEIVVEVSDGALTGSGLMPGTATVHVIPTPGMTASFEVSDPHAGEATPDPGAGVSTDPHTGETPWGMENAPEEG